MWLFVAQRCCSKSRRVLQVATPKSACLAAIAIGPTQPTLCMIWIARLSDYRLLKNINLNENDLSNMELVGPQICLHTNINTRDTKHKITHLTSLKVVLIPPMQAKRLFGYYVLRIYQLNLHFYFK